MTLDLQTLTEKDIDQFLGHTITPDNKAPLFDKNGHAIKRPDGTQLVLSYTHAAAYVARVIQERGPNKAQTTVDIAHLNIPFWQPVDVLLYSSDRHVILAMRSNVTKNAVGRALTTAAGFPAVINGVPENVGACTFREFKEETGLPWMLVVNACIELDPILDRPLQRYDIKTAAAEITLPGIVPTMTRTFALRSNWPREELMAMITASHESAGFLSIDMNYMTRLAKGQEKEILADFYPSEDLENQVPIRQFHTLDETRRMLEIPGMLVFPDRKSGLQPMRKIFVTAEDFMHNGSRENLDKIADGAPSIGVLPLRRAQTSFRPVLVATTQG